MTSPGNMVIDSAHIDFKLFVILDSQQLDFDNKHLEPSRTNPYIFFDGDKWVHRTATGANLQMLLQSIGVEFNENCLILQSEITDIFDNPIIQTQYCDDGETKLRMYEDSLLIDQDIATYAPSHTVNLVLVYDDINDEKRNFTPYHHGSVSPKLESTDEVIILEQLTSSGDVNVKLEWPEVYPHELSTFKVSFHDPETDELIENTQFDFSVLVTQNDHIIEEYYEESTIGTYQYQILFPDHSEGSAQVLLKLNFVTADEQELKIEEVSFSVNVVSENDN